MFADPSRADVDLYVTTGEWEVRCRRTVVVRLRPARPQCLTVRHGLFFVVGSDTPGLPESSGSGEMRRWLLAGGANRDPRNRDISIAYSRSKMLSPDGRCKFGDITGRMAMCAVRGCRRDATKAAGSRALADGDPIYALIIAGSAVTNDGRSSGLLATPWPGDSSAMLRSGLPCRRVLLQAPFGYVEAHGTGTKAGDPVELNALWAPVLGEGRDPITGLHRRLRSRRTLGTPRRAAGVAGLIKASSMPMKHRLLFRRACILQNPNPDYRLGCELHAGGIQRDTVPWPVDDTRCATGGVSAFGIAGTNAHVVATGSARAGFGPVAYLRSTAQILLS
jgi:acyl transferase domain-containing protein